MGSRGGPRTYAEALAAVDEARAVANEARLRDPGEHFPYKRDAVQDVLDNGPGQGTNNHPAHWYISTAIADACEAYVAAQETYLQNPGDATRESYDLAAQDLVEARRVHRQGRPIAPVAVAGNPDVIEQRQSATRALGKAGYTAEQIAELTNRPISEVQGALSGLED